MRPLRRPNCSADGFSLRSWGSCNFAKDGRHNPQLNRRTETDAMVFFTLSPHYPLSTRPLSESLSRRTGIDTSMEGLIWFSSASWFPSDRHNFLRLARQPAKPISIGSGLRRRCRWISVLPAGELTAKSYDDLAKTKIWPKPSQPFHTARFGPRCRQLILPRALSFGRAKGLLKPF